MKRVTCPVCHSAMKFKGYEQNTKPEMGSIGKTFWFCTRCQQGYYRLKIPKSLQKKVEYYKGGEFYHGAPSSNCVWCGEEKKYPLVVDDNGKELTRFFCPKCWKIAEKLEDGHRLTEEESKQHAEMVQAMRDEVDRQFDGIFGG